MDNRISFYVCLICKLIAQVNIDRYHQMKFITREEVSRNVNICQECEVAYIIPLFNCLGTNAEDPITKIYINENIDNVSDAIKEIN